MINKDRPIRKSSMTVGTEFLERKKKIRKTIRKSLSELEDGISKDTSICSGIRNTGFEYVRHIPRSRLIPGTLAWCVKPSVAGFRFKLDSYRQCLMPK